MLWRAIVAFLVLPGVVAFAAPLALMSSHWALFRPRPLGLLVFLAGVVILVWCVVEFYVSGRGTLAPWAPPRHLVVTGPYKFSRNPMYVGVALILMGWAILFWSLLLIAYGVLVLSGFHIRVIVGEEPWLARTYGAQWEAYRSKVPRWLYFP
jgi:protein-S-isoprenylcysteine O-methyltransferase Ste14